MEFICEPENLKDELKLLINLFNTKKIKQINFNSKIVNDTFYSTITIFSNHLKTYNYSYKINSSNIKQFT